MAGCHDCGQELTERGQRFCHHCGAEVPRQRPPAAAVVVLAALLTLVAAGVVVFLLVRPVTTSVAGAPLGAAAPAPPPTTVTSPAEDAGSGLTSSQSPSSSATPFPDPASVVHGCYDAINNGDYQTAWDLGGQHLGRSYSAFVSGFASTVHDDLTITSVSGDTVHVTVAAQETDGYTHLYTGSYTVQNGEIRHGSLNRSG